MRQRLNDLFNVSKTRAFIVSVLCFIAACLMLLLGTAFVGIYIGMMCWSITYGIIWFLKFDRDRLTIEQSKAASQKQVEAAPSMTSAGSNRFFVPEPLDRP